MLSAEGKERCFMCLVKRFMRPIVVMFKWFTKKLTNIKTYEGN